MRGLIALAALALMSCAPVANEPAATPAPAAPAPVSSTKPDTVSDAGSVSAADCTARGGSMQRVGRMQGQQCVVPFADGGRSCTDGSQCASGRCIDESPQARSTGAVTGVCQRTNVQFGCFSRVTGGRAEATLCVD